MKRAQRQEQTGGGWPICVPVPRPLSHLSGVNNHGLSGVNDSDTGNGK